MDGKTKNLQCLEVWGGNHLVDTSVSMSGLDAWILARPAEGATAGGDVYYLSSCAAGEVTRLLIADVAGHGPRVAELAAHLRNLMRRFIVFHDQRRLVRSINRRFASFATNGNFATAVVLTFEASRQHLAISNAGHPAPLVYRAATGLWDLLTADGPDNAHGLPLGIEHHHPYEKADLSMQVGDLVLCYTDSLSEAHGEDGEPIGPRGLLRIARSIGLVEPGTLIPALLERIAALDPRNLAKDDLTVLLFRPNGRRTGLSLRDRVTAPFRVTREVARTFLPLRVEYQLRAAPPPTTTAPVDAGAPASGS